MRPGSTVPGYEVLSPLQYNCQRDSFLILRNIQKGLIQRQRLDYISILMKDFVYLTGDGLINVHSSGYKDKLGT